MLPCRRIPKYFVAPLHKFSGNGQDRTDMSGHWRGDEKETRLKTRARIPKYFVAPLHKFSGNGQDRTDMSGHWRGDEKETHASCLSRKDYFSKIEEPAETIKDDGAPAKALVSPGDAGPFRCWPR